MVAVVLQTLAPQALAALSSAPLGELLPEGRVRHVRVRACARTCVRAALRTRARCARARTAPRTRALCAANCATHCATHARALRRACACTSPHVRAHCAAHARTLSRACMRPAPRMRAHCAVNAPALRRACACALRMRVRLGAQPHRNLDFPGASRLTIFEGHGGSSRHAGEKGFRPNPCFRGPANDVRIERVLKQLSEIGATATALVSYCTETTGLALLCYSACAALLLRWCRTSTTQDPACTRSACEAVQ